MWNKLSPCPGQPINDVLKLTVLPREPYLCRASCPKIHQLHGLQTCLLYVRQWITMLPAVTEANKDEGGRLIAEEHLLQ